MKKKKLQITSKGRSPSAPKWIPPEKRMKTYTDYGYKEHTDDIKKVRFPRFLIIVPSEWDKKELQAAFEYLHDNRLIDTDYVAVNCVVHSYEEPPESISSIVVDDDLYHRFHQKLCAHKTTFIQNGIKYCDNCFKALEITSFRD